MENVLENLFPLLKIKSVKSAPKKGAPFGEGIRAALDYSLDLAEKMGFHSINYDGYIGEVIIGEGEPFGILCHLDVVPEGNLKAWKTDPFTPTIVGDKLFCRGATDDKSAAISVLTALFRLKSEDAKFKRQVKLILGCDEESGWGCIDHSKKRTTLPEEGFSPDAEFPLIYSEKGILHLRYRFDKKKPFSARGGIKVNVVCDHSFAEGDFIDAKAADGVKLSNDKAESFGIAAHASLPEKGDNAIKYLTAFLAENDFVDKTLYDRLFGAREGVTDLFDETGHLTFSPNIIETDEDNVYFTVDVRYPSTLEKDFVLSALKRIGEYNELSCHLPLYVDKDCELIKTLLGVYKEVTKKDGEAIAIGGGTYARALKRAVAFGPSMTEEESSSIHMPNEFIYLDTLEKMTEIYYRAIKKLCTKG